MDERPRNFSISSNQVVCSTSNSLAVVNGINISDISVEAKVDVSPSGSLGGLITRCDQKGTAYGAGLIKNGGVITATIGRYLNGNFTVLFQKPVSNASGTVRFDTIGNTLTLYFEDNLIGSVTDTAISSPGSIGISGSGSAHFDSFNATTE